MENMEKKINKVHKFLEHETWYQDVAIFVIDDDLCMDISDCKQYETDINNCLDALHYHDDIDVVTTYEDDYFYCEYCDKYHWVHNGFFGNMVVIGDCNTVCRDCLMYAEENDKELVEDYLDHIINNPCTANEFLSNECLESHGFKKTDDVYDSGLYEHNKNHSPEKILRYYERIGYDVIFNIERSNPFETMFNVYIRKVK